MSTDNPYSAPGLSPVAAPPRSAVLTPQPSGFVTVCVLMIILSVMGGVSSFFGIVGLVAGPAMQEWAQKMKPKGGAQADLEAEMQREIAAATDHWRPVSFCIQTVHFVVSLAILAGSIFCLRRRETGLALLGYGCIGAAVYEVINTAVQIIVSLQTFPITSRFMKRTMENAPGNMPADVGRMMATTMNVMMWVTIGFLILWTIVKLFAEIYTFRYTLRPEVDSYVKGGQANLP